MKVAVVTGVSSFIGCHLAKHFAAQGWRVIGTISRPRDQYDGIAAERLAAVEPHAELRALDLRDDAAIVKFAERAAPALWVHHAGYATNYASPDYDIAQAEAVNVAPLKPLYAALRDAGCGVIVSGSSAEYAASAIANREDETAPPDTPYGVSKRTETRRAEELAASNDVPTRVARVFIPFGPLDNPQKLLAQVTKKLLAGEPIALSPCTQRRDFIGISDLTAGYARLAGDLARGGFDIFNIASGEAVVLRDLLLEIAARFDANPELLRFGALAMREGEPEVSYADIGKARRLLNWSPSPLREAIGRDLAADALHRAGTPC